MSLRAPSTCLRRYLDRRKIDRKARPDRGKSVAKRPKNTKIPPSSALRHSGTLCRRWERRPRAVWDASGRVQERSRDGSGGLKRLQECLGARPGSLRWASRRRRDAAQARSERRSACEQPQHRIFVVFWYERGRAKPQFSSANAMFC